MMGELREIAEGVQQSGWFIAELAETVINFADTLVRARVDE